MLKANLEISDFRINTKRERWRTYFTLAVSPSFDPDAVAVMVLPDLPILFTKKTDNFWSFAPEGEGSEGLLALCDNVELNSYRRVGMWISHSRDASRSAGEVLESISTSLGTLPSIIPTGLSSMSLWAVAPSVAVGGIGSALKAIGDRDMGYINMDERFGEEFLLNKEVHRSQTSSSGLVTVNWKWVVR